jgi:hypothetical protein
MDIVTLPRLNRALSDVTGELDRLGVFDERVHAVDVYLVPFSTAYRYQLDRGTGEIRIPMLSLSKIGDLFRHQYTSLRDVLRHEYAHAIADTHRGLIRSRRFRAAFGDAHDVACSYHFDSEIHITEYAANRPWDDFAETFMVYVRQRGRLAKRHTTPWIKDKWRFVRDLCTAIKAGRRRW